jgi:transcription antitermination factor NusG
MSASQTPYPDDFLPGDDVRVIDGIFAGRRGKVLTPEEARELRERNGGEDCRYDVIPGRVWVALPVFERSVPVMLEPFQIRHDGNGNTIGSS